MQFSEKLKKLRAEKGVSQSELAEKIYVSRSAVAKWENGLGLPSGESLNMLAEFFGVEKSELLSDPETANVIVNKNNALSKQKLWIVTLVALSCVLILVAAILIPLALKKPSSNDLVYVHTQELIFETEMEIADLDAKNYSDETISADKYFAPTRIFTYNSRITTIILPRALLKDVNGNKVTYNYVYDLNCTVSENCTVRYNIDQKRYYVLATDAPYSEKTEYCVNLSFGDMRLSIKLRQEAIQVENIELSLNSDVPDKVDIDSLTEISAQLTPYDATYQAIHYSIEKVLKPDGTPYEGHTQYANLYMSDKIYLRTTQKIDVGAKIYLSAIAEKDQVRSNVLEIEIRRVPIKDITLMTNNETPPNEIPRVNLGETFYFRPVALDENATFNVKGENFEVTLKTPELAEIEYSRGLNVYFITATSDGSKSGEKIEVFVTSPEGFSKTFSWTINNKSVEKVIIVNADTGKELDKEFTVAKGETVRLEIKVLPEDAAYKQKSFKYTINVPDYLTINEDDDVLTVTVFENVPGGKYGGFYASVLPTFYPYQTVTSSVYTMTVERTPVESVILKTDTDILAKGGNAILTYEIFPANADVSSVNLSQLKNVAGITYVEGINKNYGIHADYSAVGGSQVSYMVVCDGVESNIVTLDIQKIPVKEVILGADTFSIVNGKSCHLWYEYNLGADPESVELKLLDEIEGVYVYEKFILTNRSKLNSGTKFRLQAIVDGIESNVLNFEVVDSAPPEEIFELEKNSWYWLDGMFYPDEKRDVLFIFCTYSTDRFAILNRLNYGITQNILMIDSTAYTGEDFKIMALVDGVADRIFTIKVIDPSEKQSVALTANIQAEEFKKKHGF